VNGVMNLQKELNVFFKTVKEDARISPIHISLFTAIVQYASEQEGSDPVCFFSKDVMRLAKISGLATYHRSIKELHQYGYIKYVPSYNHFLGSLVYFINSDSED